MSFISIKSKFHVALDGEGLLLAGAPDRLAYKQEQAPIYGQRFASGDRSYNDFAQWWYMAMTDWSGGFKDTISWADDAKFHHSVNIDAWSKPGSFQLARQATDEVGVANAGEYIRAGTAGSVGGVVHKYIGTAERTGTSEPALYEETSGNWFEKAQTPLAWTSQNAVAQLVIDTEYLWVLSIGVGATNVVLTWDGTNFSDKSSDIYNAGSTITFQPKSSRTMVVDNGVRYIFVDNNGTKFALVKTSVVNPTLTTDWTKVFERTSGGFPIDITAYNGKLYYLLGFGTYIELRAYDLASDVDISVQTFRGANATNLPTYEVGGRLLMPFQGRLIITIPSSEIWEINGSTLTRLLSVDDFKQTTLGTFASVYLDKGGVVSQQKIWWGNLTYDGTHFYNTYLRKWDDDETLTYYPIFTDSSDVPYYTSDIATTYTQNLVKQDNKSTSSYKGTTDNKNYLVFSQFDNISAIDKLAYSITLIFDPLVSGQSIEVEYLLGELAANSTWTSLGVASFAVDAGVVTTKELLFATAVTFKKIWFRVKLEAGGTNTPIVNDFILAYYPIPPYKKLWTININCGDEVKRLDGTLVTTVGRELKGRLERAWWTKSLLDYQDLDYATTLVDGAISDPTATTITVDNTYDFPEQGRFRIDDEEITYTSKTPTTFVGCARGARSTRATTHLDNAVLNNAYKVLITDFVSRIPIALEDKELEYTVGISIREA
jgi:hypothetical protein